MVEHSQCKEKKYEYCNKMNKTMSILVKKMNKIMSNYSKKWIK